MIELVLQQFAFLFLTFILIFTLGKSILVFFSPIKDNLLRNFITNIIGILTIIVCYSIYKSNLKTIIILVFPIIFLLFHTLKQHIKKHSFKTNLAKDFSISLLALCIIFIFQLYFYIDLNSLLFKPISRDYFFYASVSDSLKLFGTENFFPAMNHFFPGKLGLMPYHYPELWLNAFISQLFLCASTNSYLLIVSPLLNGTLLIGISSLFEKKIHNIFLLFFISFMLLGVSGLFFPLYSHLSYLYESWWHSIVSTIGYSGTKFSFSYIFILLAIILLSKKSYYIGLIVLTLVPIFSVGMLPGIWGGTILFLLLNLFTKSIEITKKESFLILGLICFELTLFYLFYRIFGQSYTSNYASNQIVSTLSTIDGNFLITIKHFIGNITSYYIKMVIFYIPYFLPLLVMNKWKKPLWFLTIIILFCASFTTTITHNLTDSTQFTSNIGVLIVCLIIVDFASAISSMNKRTSYLTYLMIFCLSFLFLYSAQKAIEGKTAYFIEEGNQEFVNQVSKIVSKNPAPILVFYSKEYYKNSISIRSACSVFDKEIIKIHQQNNIPLITPAGNVELYKECNYMNYADSFYYSQFSPVIVWEQIDSTHTLETFIKQYHLKYFYFMNTVDVPQYIKILSIKEITSQSTQSKFIYISEQ